jgi:hypothetical protein
MLHSWTKLILLSSVIVLTLMCSTMEPSSFVSLFLLHSLNVDNEDRMKAIFVDYDDLVST